MSTGFFLLITVGGVFNLSSILTCVSSPVEEASDVALKVNAVMGLFINYCACKTISTMLLFYYLSANDKRCSLNSIRECFYCLWGMKGKGNA